MRDSYNGSTAVSKTVNVGSIPTSRALTKKQAPLGVCFFVVRELVGIELGRGRETEVFRGGIIQTEGFEKRRRSV